MNRKQLVVLLGGIAALYFVYWKCFEFPMTDIPMVENVRIRIFVFLWVVIISSTGYFIYTLKDEKPRDEQKE